MKFVPMSTIGNYFNRAVEYHLKAAKALYARSEAQCFPNRCTSWNQYCSEGYNETGIGYRTGIYMIGMIRDQKDLGISDKELLEMLKEKGRTRTFKELSQRINEVCLRAEGIEVEPITQFALRFPVKREKWLDRTLKLKRGENGRRIDVWGHLEEALKELLSLRREVKELRAEVESSGRRRQAA